MPTADDLANHTPIYAVWEITLACDQHCSHCGSRAGRKRPRELTLLECQDVVAALAAMGTREVTLIGGEAYLRRDWLDIVRAVADAGMLCTVQTGGRSLTLPKLSAARDAGLGGLGVTFQGHRDVHDQIRGVPGLYDQGLQVLRNATDLGLVATANTQLSPDARPDLTALCDDLIAAGCSHWRLGLIVPMGNAADHAELLFQPDDLLTLMPRIAALRDHAARHGMAVIIDNSLGYFGPHEAALRWSGDEPIIWSGCQAGSTVISVESDGTVKGCPSLPTGPYAGRRVTEIPLAQTWADDPTIGFTRDRGTQELWGFCASCYYADVCKAGCSFSTHSTMGRRGNQPFCHHRALELQRQGLREQIVQVEAAPGVPYDFGRFEVQGADGAVDQTRQRDPAWRPGRTVGELMACPNCSHHIWTDTSACPFCDVDVPAATARKARQDAALNDMLGRMEAALAEVGITLP